MKEMIALFEMANIRPARSGLPFVIWVSVKGGAQHGCRIKVCLTPKWSNEYFSMTVPDGKVIGDASSVSSDQMKKILNFIEINRVILFQYWNEEIDTGDLIEQLTKV